MRLSFVLALVTFASTAHATSRGDLRQDALRVEARVSVAQGASHEAHAGRTRLAPREVAFFAACAEDRVRAEVRVEPSREGHAFVSLLLHDAPACGEHVVASTRREVRFADEAVELTLRHLETTASARVVVARLPTPC